MKQLCTYIVTEDSGFAPNPFWGWCTLAACTPNHRNAQLNKGDWIAGFLSKKRQNSLLYAMELARVVDMSDYFTEKTFQKKKPNPSGGWKELCGDNIYERQGEQWLPHTILFHHTAKNHKQDTKNHKVFVGSRFWYFGQSYKGVPPKYRPLIKRYSYKSHDPVLAAQFITWVARSFSTGIYGDPNDIRGYGVQLTRHR